MRRPRSTKNLERYVLLNANAIQFSDVKGFLNDISKDKRMQASAKQIKFLQNKSQSKTGSPDGASIWTNDDDADLCASSVIVPKLTAVMTMAYHMDDAKHLGDDRNHRLYLKGVAIDLIQAWLDELGRKQRTELSTLQVEVLLLLSKSLGGLQPEKLWSSTGALVRSAMVMGLNVDPANVKECSQIILSYQDFFTVPALALVTSKPSALQNFFYQCCKTDILWAALTCCQQIKQNLRSTPIDSTHDSADLIHTVGTTITYLIDRIGQKGSDLKDIVFLTLALQSAQLQDDFPEKLQVLQEVVQKTLAACREKLLHPLVSSESSINTVQPSKGANKDAALLPILMPDMAVPLDSSSRLTPTSSIDAPFFLGSATNVDHSFGNLFDLAAEYSTFEASMYSPDDLLNFGTAQSWNWEHMWQ
ncbi:hypothetical protein N0V94_005118 [Neodidymelliopsis sp. IMI 364377]|nr:hypothetical protein N0V94_005118 [Neodidymelliopsis sp. IMI 364377]